jgi:serine/threonine-protein kinase RsbW
MDGNFQRTLHDGKAGFPQFLEAIESHLEGSGVPIEVVHKTMIVFDEVVSNILNHGAIGSEPTITAHLRIEPGRLFAEVLDDGPPFDPLSLREPDLSLSVEDRPIGGLGIHLVRELTDSLGYSHDGRCNRLHFSNTYSL